MKRTVIVFSISIILLHSVVTAQKEKENGITTEMLDVFQEQFHNDNYKKAILNAVTNNSIKELALNRLHIGKIDHYFDVKIETEATTNQKKTGRCWLFTSLNILRPKVIAKYNLENFEFSENYCFFWDQLEKSNFFLEGVIETRTLPLQDRKVEWFFKNPVSDGGVWNMAVAIIEKYGLVPDEIMSETLHSENTATMRKLLRRKLREYGLTLRRLNDDGKDIRSLREAKKAMLQDIYTLLVFYLGEPPRAFTWRTMDKNNDLLEFKGYSPKKFYKHAVGIDLQSYVMLMNDPTRDYFRLYEVEYDRNIVDQSNWIYVNLPTNVLKLFAKESLLNQEAMYFSCDVGKQLVRDEGILSVENYDYESLFGISFGMDKKDRILTFDSGSSHGMALVGVDTSATGDPVKWLLENSWGKEKGRQGFLIMTDEWFDEYSFRLVVRRDFVSDDVLAVLEQKPIILKPWDPMFLPFEDLSYPRSW